MHWHALVCALVQTVPLRHQRLLAGYMSVTCSGGMRPCQVSLMARMHYVCTTVQARACQCIAWVDLQNLLSDVDVFIDTRGEEMVTLNTVP